MKDGHREKLRQLPKERKLYLLQQNQHIKENRVVDSALRKSMPTSNSSTSLFPPKALRQKSAMKRSETSSRLLFNNNNSNNNNNGKHIKMDTSSSFQSLSSAQSEDSTSRDKTPNSLSDSNGPNDNSIQEANYIQSSPSPTTTSKAKVNKKKSVILGTNSNDLSASPTTPTPSNEEKASNTLQPPKSSPVDRRAATYKYARRNLTSTVNSNRSKVGSMILEFDALAHKLEDTTSDESTAWLLLDNKTLPRHYNNNSIQQLNNSHHHPSLNHLFPSTSNKPPYPSPGTESVSSSLLTNSYAYQSLTRKDGSRLASIAGSTSTTPTIDEKRGRDRNSPYYYVERLRSRYSSYFLMLLLLLTNFCIISVPLKKTLYQNSLWH